MKNLYLTCLLLFSLFLITTGQTVYNKKQLIDDLRVLKTILLNTNPVLTGPQRDTLEDKLSTAIKNFPLSSATPLQFMKYIGSLKVETGYDDHANIFLGEAVFPDSALFFPVPLYVLGDSVLINSDETALDFGGIVQSINGISIREILKKLYGGGDKSSFRRSKLPDTFSVLFFLAFGSHTEFTVCYRSRIFGPKTASCAGVRLREVLKLQANALFPLNKNAFNNKVNINRRFDEVSKWYYVQISSFGLARNDSSTTYRQFEVVFDSLFEEISEKAANFLLIDIRGNGGGQLDVPGLLYSYLTDSVFYEAQYLTMPPLKNIPLNYLKAIDNGHITSENDAKKKIYRVYDGFTTNNGKAKKAILYKRAPSPHAFRGPVMLLTDEGTFSAAAYFAALFRQHKRGDIIGPQLQSAIEDITAGHLLQYELPNTRIRMTVPLARITFDDAIYNNTSEHYTFPFDMLYRYFLKKQDWADGLKYKAKN